MLAHHYREALSLAEAAGLDATRATRAGPPGVCRRRAQRALSLGAGAGAHELALEALALTPEDVPERPQLSSSSPPTPAGCWTARMSETLGEQAIEGFLAQGDFGHAADAVAAARQRLLLPRRHRSDAGRRATGRSSSPAGIRRRRRRHAPSRAWRGADTSSTATWRARSSSRARRSRSRESGDDRTKAICLNTIGMARVRAGDAEGDRRHRAERRARATVGLVLPARHRPEQPREHALGGRDGSRTARRASTRHGRCASATGSSRCSSGTTPSSSTTPPSEAIWRRRSRVRRASSTAGSEARRIRSARYSPCGRSGCSRSVRWSGRRRTPIVPSRPGARPAPTPRSRCTSSRPPR